MVQAVRAMPEACQLRHHCSYTDMYTSDLDPSLQNIGQTVTTDAGRGGRNAEKLVTDYMSALGDHLMYTLREKLGDSVVKSTPLEFVVTVPAIWSDLAKDKTKKACHKASGLSATKQPIHLVSEPEAAAIYALHGLDPHGIMVGDTVVVVDAGGGTVDLISYTITGLKPILQVQEAAPGSGALCGSTFLNMRFAKFLKAKLGKEDGFDDEVLADAMEVFEKKVKRQFTINAAPDETFTIPVGGLANNKALGITRGRYALKASDLQTIFEPVVLEVIKLIKDQITASAVPIKAVLLVGGFGASNYLKERVRNSVDRRIQIMQPPNAWQAVVQGAVMKGLANSAPEQLTMVQVQNRKARKHYGTEWRTRFDEKLHSHLKSKRQWCGLDGCYKIYAMEWFIVRVREFRCSQLTAQPANILLFERRVTASRKTSPSSPPSSGPASLARAASARSRWTSTATAPSATPPSPATTTSTCCPGSRPM